MSCAGRWIIIWGCGWDTVCDCVWLFFYFPTRPEMSSLSLLFKFVVVSICTCSSSEMCSFFFFFLFDENGDFIFSLMIGAGDFVVDSVASVVLTVFTVVVVVVLNVCLFWEFFFEFFPFLVTCIHPSSSFLLGWSSISFIVGPVVFSVAVALVVMVGEFIVAVVVVIVVLVVVFWGQVLEKCPSCLQDHHHCLVSVFNYVGNVVKPSPIEAQDENVVTVCRPPIGCFRVILCRHIHLSKRRGRLHLAALKHCIWWPWSCVCLDILVAAGRNEW